MTPLIVTDASKEVRLVRNTYEDPDYAESYAGLEWGGTYHLVRRDLPAILGDHVTGNRALDFGCGTGRSTRLLRSLRFDVVGVDISPAMIARARAIDSDGRYELLQGTDLDNRPPAECDLILAAFPFDNIPASEKPPLFRGLARLLAPAGRIVNIVSTPELYLHEWASFSTRDYPENRRARTGDLVRSVTTAFRHGKPADDVLCTDEGYRVVYGEAGLEVEATYRPLGRADDGVAWVSETTVAPWAIYVLKKAG